MGHWVVLVALILLYCSICESEYKFICGSRPAESNDAESGGESDMTEKNSDQMGCNLVGGSEIQGLKGQKGDAGLDGEKGAKGARGPYGNFGPQGPRGRTGERGDQGPPGLKGDVGTVGQQGESGPKGDMGEAGNAADKVDKIEFENYIRDMEERLMLLQGTVENLRSCCTSLPTMTTRTTTLGQVVSSECLLVYNDKCFKLIGTKEVERSFDQFEIDCIQLGGAPANIYDSRHYNLTVQATRDDRSRPGSTHMMLGMRYDVFKRQLQFRNRTAADLTVQWRPGNPTGHPTHTHIQLYVTPNPNQVAQGMYNRADNHNRAFGLCEIGLEDEEGFADEREQSGSLL